MKGLEQLFLGAYVASSGEGQVVVTLATKYKVPFLGGKAQAGCPGIMSPLGETSEIELRWGSGTHNQDKSDRFKQFAKALEVIETYGSEGFKNKYLELNIHGRVMLSYIAEKNGFLEQILTSIQEYATQGLAMDYVPYGKGGATVKAIFNKYMLPKITSLKPLSLLSSEVVLDVSEEKEKKESKKEVKISSKEISSIKKLVSEDFMQKLCGVIDDEHDTILDVAERISDRYIEDACTVSCPSILNLLMQNDLDSLMAVALSGEEITEISY